MMGFKDYLQEQEDGGSYVGVRFSLPTKERMRGFLDRVPNAVPFEKIHSTLIYSRKRIDFVPMGEFKTPWYATADKFENWKTQDGKNALILLLKCDKMVNRHKEIMNTTDATYEYDEYKPHITLSYDVPEGFKDFSLPHIRIGLLEVVEEYYEDLDLNWAT